MNSLPDDFAKCINVSSIVLSTAHSAPGIIDRASAMVPLDSNSFAPGCVFSMFVRKSSCQVRYLMRKKEQLRFFLSILNILIKSHFNIKLIEME